MKHWSRVFWNSKWILSVSIGILLGLSWPPFPFPFFVFPAFIFIFCIIDLSTSAREAAFYTYPAFLIWNIIATYWLMLATIAGGVAAILANAALMTIPVMLQFKIQQKKISFWLSALLQASCWVGYEYLIHQWQLAWPWLTIGNAWSNVPGLIQYISVTGFWGVSLWVLLSSALAYKAIIQPTKYKAWLFTVILLFFPLWSGTISLLHKPSHAHQKQEVVVVQPNFDSYNNYGGYGSSVNAINHLLRLTDSVRTPKTNLVVWPENAVQNPVSNGDSFRNTSTNTKRTLQEKANEWDATIIAGATYFEYYNNGEVPPLPYKIGQQPYLPFNAALAFSPHQPMGVYRKHNLVPLVERIPYVHFLNTVDVFHWINWNRIQGYGKGNRADQFTVGNTKTPALICYDSVYPGWVRKFVSEGAGYLTIITNDGWWGDTSGHKQHFAYARLRAIEFNRWIVRSANNGISGIIAPDGTVKVKTTFSKPTSFRYNIPILTEQTFYTRFGDWLPIGLLIIFIGGMILIMLRK